MMQELTQEIKNLMQDVIRDVHTAIPGRVVSFDPDKCEATIQPTAKFRKPDGAMIDFPKISEVPMYFPQSALQKVSFVYHIKPGDECLIIMLEQALDQWRTGAESATELRFDMQNAIAIPGLFAKPNPLVKRAHDNESIIIQRDDSFIELFGTTGQIDIFATDDINVETEKDLNVKAANDIIVEAAANIKITANANLDIKSVGAMTVNSDTSIAVTAPIVNIN